MRESGLRESPSGVETQAQTRTKESQAESWVKDGDWEEGGGIEGEEKDEKKEGNLVGR